MNWKIIERPGYFGRKRDELVAKWNQQYGNNNWRIAYQWGSSIVPRDMALQFYEDAYYEFLKKDSDALNWLISTASDIYDTATTNVKSGFDYGIQETERTHIQDISIRRAVARLGKKFEGDHLVEVRGESSEGYRLNPGVVPFHLPELIFVGEVKDYGGSGIWWKKNTIEDFYQRNKVLQVLE